MKVTNTNDIKPNIDLLVYGDAGVGKTVLCATAPKPIIISAEGGLLSLRGSNTPVIECKGIDDVNEAYDYLTVGKGKGMYRTVCIDSLSEIAEALLAEELGKTKDPRKAYGAMNENMATLVRAFRDMDAHTYFTAKVRKIEDEETGGLIVMPSAPGQGFMQNLPYFFDEVGYMYVTKNPRTKQSERRLQFVGTPRLVAKDRSGNLDEVEQPNLTKLFKKIIN